MLDLESGVDRSVPLVQPEHVDEPDGIDPRGSLERTEISGASVRQPSPAVGTVAVVGCVSQSGYALMAICVIGRNDAALPSLLFFLLGYAVANLAAFAVIAHLRGRTSVADYHGLGRRRPWASLTLTLGFLSLVGIPPLVGFFGKLMLFISTIEAGYAWLATVAVVNTVISLFYYLRVIGPMYFWRGQSEVAVLSNWTAGAMIAGAFMAVGFGEAAGMAIRMLDMATMLP